MKVQAHIKNYRMSPRKVRPVANLVKGLSIADASDRLLVCVNKPAEAIAKLISSAAANAENNFQLDKNSLFVKDITVHEGMKLKRWMPRAQGRATRILKRMAHITVVLESIENDTKKQTPPSQKTVKKIEKKEEKKESKPKKNVRITKKVKKVKDTTVTVKKKSVTSGKGKVKNKE